MTNLESALKKLQQRSGRVYFGYLTVNERLAMLKAGYKMEGPEDEEYLWMLSRKGNCLSDWASFELTPNQAAKMKKIAGR